jgi:hypothetical protein
LVRFGNLFGRRAKEVVESKNTEFVDVSRSPVLGRNGIGIFTSDTRTTNENEYQRDKVASMLKNKK